jgi:hypothetical protein
MIPVLRLWLEKWNLQVEAQGVKIVEGGVLV